MKQVNGLLDSIGTQGLRLIEASAGTGKTYNLIEVYSRLIESDALDSSCILVMTFTKAATEDIRRKVQEKLLMALSKADPQDATKLERLQRAIECLSEAPVSTIHAFALRATTELVLESGALFNRGRQIEERVLFKEALNDFWRDQALGRQKLWVDFLYERFKGPKGLYDRLEPAIDKPFAVVTGVGKKELCGLADELRSLWHRLVPSIRQRSSMIDSLGAFNASKKLAKRLKEFGGMVGFIEHLGTLLEGEGIPVGIRGLDWLEDLSKEGWEDQLKKGYQNKGFHSPFEEGFLEKLLSLRKFIASGAFFLKEALAEAKVRVEGFKQERRLFSYADMIQGFHRAISDPRRGKPLAKALAELWPCILIDEFQDTDPIQYEILKTIHKEAPKGLMLMIGDPKQAIYSFRGGDVFAYLMALRDVLALGKEGRISLQTNHRSSQPLIHALNTLFRGAPNPFILEGIEYKEVEVSEKNRHSGLVYDTEGQNQRAPALYFVRLRPNEGKEATKAPRAKKLMLEACIETILKLLDGRLNLKIQEVKEAQEGQAAVKTRSIKPKDIAVLVNTNQEASRLQRQLAKRGIPSVCLHEQSVFQTNEALEVLRLLRAVALPGDERSVRSALLSLLGLKTLRDFAAFETDPKKLEEEIERFKRARERWEKGGVLAMLVPFLQDAMPAILGLDDGERRMSNYLQIAELLAEMEGLSFGMEGLIRSMERAMAEGGGEDAKIRLESDGDLVTVNTVHKAKGLEYGIVFLPFAPFIGLGGEKSPLNPPLFYHEDEARACLSFENDDDAAKKAIREYRAEGVRLLYVALTRAKYGVFLGYGPINTAQNGALAWVLHRSEGVIDTGSWLTRKMEFSFWFNEDNTERRLRGLAEGSSGTIATLEPSLGLKKKDRLQEGFLLLSQEPRSDLPKPPKPWGFFSFSGLLPKATPSFLPGPGWGDEAWDREPPKASLLDQSPSILPKGQAFGSAFHSLMQRADFSALAKDSAVNDPELRELAKGCLVGWGVLPADSKELGGLIEAFLELGRKTITHPLPGIGCSLKDIPQKDRVLEMEFFFRLDSTKTSEDFLKALNDDESLDLPFLGHSQKTLRGLMNGFIDMVFRVEGRYYILDYKTNDLGQHKDAYSKEAIRAAMVEHAYDLQYTIYLIALHRYLKAHLKGYTPKALGGVYYLFVRGLQGLGENGIFYSSGVQPSWILRLDSLLAPDTLP